MEFSKRDSRNRWETYPNKAPSNSGTMYYNYLNYISVVLQRIADVDCKFIFIDVGGYGKQSDAGTFAESQTFQFLEDFEKNLPKPCPFEGSDGPMPFVFVGDDAYPLKVYLMKPYPGNNLSQEQRIFNYRLSRFRRCVECTFGIITSKWALLKKAIETKVEKAETIIKCICLLHNIIFDREGPVTTPAVEKALEQYRSLQNEPLRTGRTFNRSTQEAQEVRNKYKRFFNGSGAVSWQ